MSALSAGCVGAEGITFAGVRVDSRGRVRVVVLRVVEIGKGM